MPYCTECGGRLTWDRKLKHYSCQSCGMTFNEAELSEALERLHTPREDAEELKNKRHQEYLEWWLKEKKGRR
ncbi:MAG: hypothetical protein ACUVV4_03500 [Candidatus Bathyarchaeia archaeon]